MYQIDYVEDRAIKQAAWKEMERLQRRSAQWFLKGFLTVMCFSTIVYYIVNVVEGVMRYGPAYMLTMWHAVVSVFILIFFESVFVCKFFLASKKVKQKYLEKPDRKRRLVLSEQIIRLYNEKNEQIVAIHWNNNINVVQIDEGVLICYGQYRCLAAISKQVLEEQGGAELLQQAVQRFQENASPITETIWKALLIPRPNLVWGASYSLKGFFKKQMQKRMVLFVVVVGVVYWLMFGFQPITLIALTIVITILGLRLLMLKKKEEQNARKYGVPMGVKEMPARFELYEEGIQISRGEEGSFWEWSDVERLQITKNELNLKKGKGIITAITNEAFSTPEEKQRVIDFLQSHINSEPNDKS